MTDCFFFKHILVAVEKEAIERRGDEEQFSDQFRFSLEQIVRILQVKKQ